MTAIASTIIAGPYDLTWNSTAIGMTTEDGIRHITRIAKSDVTASKYGQQVIDKVYLGQNVRITFDLIEWTSNMRLFLNAYGTTLGIPGVVGRFDTTLAQVLVATALTGSAAAAALGPATRTYHSAIISNEKDVEYAMNANWRVIPVAVDIYLANISSVEKYFTDT